MIETQAIALRPATAADAERIAALFTEEGYPAGRPAPDRGDRPRGALVGRQSRSADRTRSQPPYCQRKKRAAIPKQATVQPTSTATHNQSGENAAPFTMTWRMASDR